MLEDDSSSAATTFFANFEDVFKLIFLGLRTLPSLSSLRYPSMLSTSEKDACDTERIVGRFMSKSKSTIGRT